MGNLTLDHAFWGPPEYMTAANMPRPAYVVESTTGASDLAGSMAAALAASAMAVSKYGSNATAVDSYLAAAASLYNAVRSCSSFAVMTVLLVRAQSSSRSRGRACM